MKSNHRFTTKLLALMRFGNFRVESQRDSGSKPKVARNELPWETPARAKNPIGVSAMRGKRDTTPLGLKPLRATTQGWKTQSLWDWRTADNSSRLPDSSFARNFQKALGSHSRLAIILVLICISTLVAAGTAFGEVNKDAMPEQKALPQQSGADIDFQLEFQPPKPRRQLHWWWLLPPITLAGGIFARAAARKVRGVDALDPREFHDALNIWSEVILGQHETPRKLKRYLNRLRLMMSFAPKPVPESNASTASPDLLESHELVYLSAERMAGKLTTFIFPKTNYQEHFKSLPSASDRAAFAELSARLGEKVEPV